MNVRFKNPFSKTQIFISLFLIVAAITFFPKANTLNNIYSGRQLASVASVGSGPNACYVQSDITTLENEKTSFETQLLAIDTRLITLESEIQETVNDYDTQTLELEKLKREIVSDDVLALRQEGIDIAQQKLTEVEQSPQGGGVCSTDGYYDQASCENAGYFYGGSCTGGSGYNDQKSCEDAGYMYGGGCSNSAYYDQTSCINGGGTGYVDTYSYGGYGTGYCSNPSYTDQQSCINAGRYAEGSCSAPGYYDQQSCENAEYKYGGYCTGGWMYPDQASCENAGSYPGYCSNSSYTDENSCLSAVCSYTPAYCSDGTSSTYEQCIENGSSWSEAQSTLCGNMWTPGAASYGYQWVPEYSYRHNNYTWSNGVFISENNTWTEPTWYSYWNPWYWFVSNTWTEPTFQKFGYYWNPGTWNTYGYTWKSTDNTGVLAGLSENIEILKTEYAKVVEENHITKQRIQSTEAKLETLTDTLRKETAEKTDIKIKRLEYEQKINEVVSQIAYAFQNQCPSVETYCSNALDDDADGQMDCNDSDCTNESSCQTGEKTDNGGIFDTILNIIGIDSSTNSSTKINYIPIEAGIPAPFITDRSLSILNLLKSNLSLLKQQNETVIVPAMKRIETKAAAGDYDELPNLMEKAQEQIDNAEAAVYRSITDTDLLKTENGLTTSDADVKAKMDLYVTSTDNLLKDYTAYFKILEKFLVESIPTPEMYMSLNRATSELENSGEVAETESAKLASIIESKNAIRQKVVSVASFTPTPGFSAPYYNPVEKISIEFNKPIEKYLGGTIILSSPDTPNFEAAILPFNSGDYSISASVSSLYPGKTYSVVTDIQLQFEGKGHSLKNTNTWTFRIDDDPTNITKTTEDDEEDKDDGSSEEEKCEKKKGFWSRLFGGKCKTAPDICCVCAYGNFNTKLSFEASCDRELRAAACTKSIKVFAATNKAVDKVIEDFPNSCPSDEYDDVRLFYEKHGDPTGEEQKFCTDLPMKIIDSYERNNMPVPSNITLSHGQCSAFNDLSEAKSWADNLSSQLESEGYVNIKITINGNQESKMNTFYNNALGGPQDMLAVEDKDPDGTSYCPANTKFEVCSSAVKVELPDCPKVGSACKYGGDDNPTIECKNMFGFQTTRQCIADSPQVSKDGATLEGTWSR